MFIQIKNHQIKKAFFFTVFLIFDPQKQGLNCVKVLVKLAKMQEAFRPEKGHLLNGETGAGGAGGNTIP